MQAKLKLMTAAAVIALSGYAFAQSQQEHQEHHPGGALTQAQPTQPSPATPTQPSPATPSQPSAQPSPPTAGQAPGRMPMGQMMQGMPEQCRTMMQSMPQTCMSMMQEMMRGEMRQGGMMGGGMMQGGMMGRGMMGGMQAPPTASDATKAYMEAADKTYGPLMEGVQAADPDIAFVRAMVAHRQGAIELAKVRVQFGKDDQTRKWADDIIRNEQTAINDMEAWLKKQAK
jgi:uncharacterized protein (DUF305 family)